MLRLLKRLWEAVFCREKVVVAWKVAGYVPFNRRVLLKFLCKENHKTETIIITMGQRNPIYKASMTLISASEGNISCFFPRTCGEEGGISGE